MTITMRVAFKVDRDEQIRGALVESRAREALRSEGCHTPITGPRRSLRRSGSATPEGHSVARSPRVS